MKEKILVFIPAYNCESQIVRTLSKFNNSIKNLFSEILIIDNRSTDNTVSACRTMIEKMAGYKVTLIQNTENYNLGGSHKVAFNYAIDNHFDYVIVLHGDDQGDIKDIIPYLNKGLHRQVDCLLGARFMKGSCLVNYSRFRTWGNYFFNILFSLMSRRKLYDLGSGLNVYAVDFLKPRFYLRFPNALTFNYYFILYTVAIKACFNFFPLTWREEDQISNVKLVKQTKQLLKVMTQYCLSRDNFMHAEHEFKRTYSFNLIAETK